MNEVLSVEASLFSFLQGGLVRFWKPRPSLDKFIVVPFDEPMRLGVQVERITLLVYRLDTIEEPAIEIDRVLMRGESGRNVFLHKL